MAGSVVGGVVRSLSVHIADVINTINPVQMPVSSKLFPQLH